jgi:hypothetical protein
MKNQKPQYWKLRFVESDRFACFFDADFEIDQYNGEKEFILTKDSTIRLAKLIIASQNKVGLPVPVMEAVPFDKNGECIKGMVFCLNKTI